MTSSQEVRVRWQRGDDTKEKWHSWKILIDFSAPLNLVQHMRSMLYACAVKKGYAMPGKIDVVVGGPPCSAMSKANPKWRE